MLKLTRKEQLQHLGSLCLHNARTLLSSLEFCARNNIQSFRILSHLLPLKTHPMVGYEIDQLKDADEIVKVLKQCGKKAHLENIRTGFHPDQFVVLNSPSEAVLSSSLAELEYQAILAEWTHADTINIHAGGGYGDKAKALESLRRNLDRLSNRVRSRLTLENDDKTFTPEDLLPICRSENVPLVYDVHHHRCCVDRLSIGEATEAAISTWNREPLFHLSSPIEGWSGPQPFRHHDYIDPEDFPEQWLGLRVTVEIEAKAKELAIFKIRNELPERVAAAAK